MKKKYTIVSKVAVWRVSTAVRYLAVADKDISRHIRENHAKPRRGFGSVRVEATLGKTVWRTSVFPHMGGRTYILPLKESVRRAEVVCEGDMVACDIEIL